MKTRPIKLLFLSSLLSCFFTIHSSKAQQLNQTFQNLFDGFLNDGGFLQRSPGEHGSHFKPSAERASDELVPALNSLIAGNISSFPLSSTTAGISFDFSTGQPVSISESLGPIFAETAKTVGKGKINFGFNYTLLNFSKLRGLNTEDINFTFTHEDVTPEVGELLGHSTNESDIMNLNLGLNAEASIFAFYITAGITPNLDISVAIPLINLNIDGTAQAIVNSFTLAAIDTANHQFGEDVQNPLLFMEDSYQSNAAGIGDLAIRLKYSLLQGTGVNLGVLLDARVPTGEEKNFLGTGKTNVRLIGILSKKIGDFTPHLNIGYDYRSADFDSDEFEFAIGFDQKLVPGLTFAISILGELDIQDNEAIALFPGTTSIRDRIIQDGVEVGTNLREISNSNIPEDIKDHIVNAAFGFRYAPSDRMQLLGNVLVPLNEGGLRPIIAPTFGLSVSL